MHKENTATNSGKTKYLIFILAVASLIALSACGSSSNLVPVHYKQYHTGIKGITMNFVKGLPPKEIYENTDFQIGLEVRNEGAWKSTNAKIRLMPIVGQANLRLNTDDTDKTSIDDETKTMRTFPEFEGKEAATQIGGYRFMSASVTGVQHPTINEEGIITFEAVACYGYKTDAWIDVCINPQRDYPGVVEKKTCTTKSSYKLSGGQGAPVAVTSIEPTTISNGQDRKIHFDITLDNAGKGRVFDRNSAHKPCQGPKDYKPIVDLDYDMIEVSAYINDKKLDCDLASGTGADDTIKTKISEKEGASVTCEYKLDEKSYDTFNTILKVEAAYGYVDTIDASVKVNRLLPDESDNSDGFSDTFEEYSNNSGAVQASAAPVSPPAKI